RHDQKNRGTEDADNREDEKNSPEKDRRRRDEPSGRERTHRKLHYTDVGVWTRATLCAFGFSRSEFRNSQPRRGRVARNHMSLLNRLIYQDGFAAAARQREPRCSVQFFRIFLVRP